MNPSSPEVICMESKIRDIQQHESKLLEKAMAVDVTLARLEEKQNAMNEKVNVNQQNTEALIANMERSIVNAMQVNIDGRIGDMANIVARQQETLNTIIQVQGSQNQQIESIQKTLEQFTKIEDRVEKIEKAQFDIKTRVSHLEETYHTMSELNKERVKGKWGTVSSIIAAASAIVCAIVATLF